jgi:Tfp pilus assembly PilM family ATPase
LETAYWRLPGEARSASSVPNVLGVAVSTARIMERLESARRLRLCCTLVDAAAAALGRLGARLHTASADQVWGILDLGDRQTRLILCIEDTPVLIRSVGTGGRVWTQRISESLQVGTKAAEVLKREHGLEEAVVGPMLAGVLRKELQPIAVEIKRSYEYALSCYPQRRAGDLILVGGGAALPHLDRFLQGLLGIAVRRAGAYLGDPQCRLDWPHALSAVGSELETCALAIGAVVPDAS